jgi:hypothetical protein
MSETVPGSERSAHQRRMLLLGGLAGAVLVTGGLSLVITLEGGGSPIPGAGSTGDNAVTDQGTGSPDVGPGVVGSAEDPVSLGVETACTMFRQGATVDEFAVWFEADIGVVGAADEELFREILLEALTETCPEVVATDG